MYEYTPPPSHYEYAAKAPSSVSEKRFKQVAFAAMRRLEGWCSQYKASTLMDLICLVQPEIVVEIGVFGGKSLVPMGYAIKALDNGGKVYGIDPWSASASLEGDHNEANQNYWANLDYEAIFGGLQQKISVFGLDGTIELIRTTSEAADPISNIGLLHIDGNHSDEASYFDICKWGPLVHKGGLIVFDDITWSTIDRALKWLDKNCVELFKVEDEGNSWGVWVKI